MHIHTHIRVVIVPIRPRPRDFVLRNRIAASGEDVPNLNNGNTYDSRPDFYLLELAMDI